MDACTKICASLGVSWRPLDVPASLPPPVCSEGRAQLAQQLNACESDVQDVCLSQGLLAAFGRASHFASSCVVSGVIKGSTVCCLLCCEWCYQGEQDESGWMRVCGCCACMKVRAFHEVTWQPWGKPAGLPPHLHLNVSKCGSESIASKLNALTGHQW